MIFCEAEQRFLLLFLEKEETLLDQLVLWGQSQTPRRRIEKEVGCGLLRSRTTFLLLFLEREGHKLNNSSALFIDYQSIHI
jgi:hypothetical protein